MKTVSKGFGVRLTGDYATSGSPPQPVVLTNIGPGDCLALQCGQAPPVGTEVEVWIGALGPLSAHIADARRNSVRFAFRAPLDGAVLSHFAGF